MKALLASLILSALALGAEPRPIKIGLLLGRDPAEAESIRRGAALGARAAGMPVRLVERGQPGQWGADGNEAAALALDEGVDGIVTPCGGTPAHQVLQVAGRTQLPVVSLCADSSVTAAGIPWAARIVPSTGDEARTIFASIGVREWTAIVPEARDGREALADLRKAARRAGVSLNDALTVSKDIQALCQQAAAARPEGILVWLEPSAAGQVANRLRAAGFTGALAGRRPHSAPEGFVSAGVSVSARFKDEFRRAHGEDPDALSAMAYDAVLVLARLAASQSPARIESIPCLDGATGSIRFDSAGNRIVQLAPIAFRDGAWRAADPPRP